jgi:hypothetical protein
MITLVLGYDGMSFRNKLQKWTCRRVDLKLIVVAQEKTEATLVKINKIYPVLCDVAKYSL